MLLCATFLADASSLAAPLINLGAIGVCLVALSLYYLKKDGRYEKRIDEMLKREKEFQQEQGMLLEKYRVAMEKFSQTLDVVVALLKKETR